VSRLRELIDAFVVGGRGKVEIDALLTELEQRAETAKAQGAYEAGRDHAPAIAELVERNTALLRALRDRGTHTETCRSQHGEARRRRFWTEADAEICSCILGRLLKDTPSKWSKRGAAVPDTPESVAEKAKTARAIGDRFTELFGGRKP